MCNVFEFLDHCGRTNVSSALASFTLRHTTSYVLSYSYKWKETTAYVWLWQSILTASRDLTTRHPLLQVSVLSHLLNPMTSSPPFTPFQNIQFPWYTAVAAPHYIRVGGHLLSTGLKWIPFIFHFLDMACPFMLQLLLIFCGTGFYVLSLVRIHNMVWVRTPWRLVYSNECSGGAFWTSLHRGYFPNENLVTTNQITQSISKNTIIFNINPYPANVENMVRS